MAKTIHQEKEQPFAILTLFIWTFHIKSLLQFRCSMLAFFLEFFDCRLFISSNIFWVMFFFGAVLLLQQWLVVSFHCVLCLIWLSSSDNYRQIWLREYFNNCTFVHTSSRVEFAHKTHNHTASVCNVEIVIIYIYPQTRWPGIYEIHIKYQDNWSKHLLPNAE